jgi:hypothetical protein
LVTNLVAEDEQSVGGALFQTSYTVGFALASNLSSLIIQKLGNDTGDLLHGLRAASGLNTACAWMSECCPLFFRDVGTDFSSCGCDDRAEGFGGR